MNVLLIEDEFLIRTVIQNYLQRNGHKVTATAMGKHALKLMAHHSYEFIISDLVLHDISGIDIIHEARRLYGEEFTQRHILVITAFGSNSVTSQLNRLRVKFLKKPLRAARNLFFQ